MTAGTIPAPFSTSRVSGYDWGAPLPAGGWNGNGQSYGWTTHQGVDYGTLAGSAIIAPFGGTAKFETGLAGYGNRLTLTLANGWKWVFGHVAAGANGAVHQGDVIGTTGRNIGSAIGPVTLVEVHNPQGTPVNPHIFMDPIFAGTASVSRLFGTATARLYGAMSGQRTGPGPAPSPTSPSAGSGPALGSAAWWTAFWIGLQNAGVVSPPAGGAGALAGTGSAIATGSGNPISDAITQGIKGVLPSPQHAWRAVFVSLGVLMIGGGALIYFKGDEIGPAVQSAGKTAALAAAA